MTATEAIWHEVECGGYGADLGLWVELAARHGGPVLDLGCGTGRVALHLAQRGHQVIAVDRDPELIEQLRERTDGLPVETHLADVREFKIAGQVPLALAPMQLLQMLPDRTARLACLRRVREALAPRGRLAAALVEELPEADGELPPLPDVREVEGWVYSSLPVEAAVADGEIVLRRLRQTVSPSGELSEDEDEVRICTTTAAELEEEAREAGLTPVERRLVPATEAHVGSAVVVVERGE
jgi:trans-aconitate methyltransferase